MHFYNLKKIFSVSKYPKNVLFNLENKVSARVMYCGEHTKLLFRPKSFKVWGAMLLHAYVECQPSYTSFAVLLFSKLNKILFGHFDAKNVSLDNENN